MVYLFSHAERIRYAFVCLLVTYKKWGVDLNANPPILVLLLSYLRLIKMETTKLSSKGQVIIPKPVRVAHHWEPGLELVVLDTNEGVLLRPKAPFQPTSIKDVASCLRYDGKSKSVDDMEKAIEHGVKERFRDRG